jgi:hypothetical protein
MSTKYSGGIITKNPVTPAGPYENSAASGIWTLEQQLQYAKQGIWPTAGNQAPDAQFNYVTMLLHGDGTNGAQNNTFLDSSTNNFTITRNGNTTQGSFSPYGSNWANYFDGAGDYLTAPASSNFEFTGDYTVEAWIYLTGFPDDGTIYATYSGGGNTDQFTFQTTGALFFAGVGTGTGVITLNNWIHVAASRSGTTQKIFINGVVQGTATVTGTVGRVSTAYIGMRADTANSVQGYISNLRIVKGTAVYTSNFTPSTTPLTAISGTSLLTCQSNRFKDNSTNNFTISTGGTPSVQRFNPFGASTAYSTSVIGGSGYFDGAGDSLQAPSGASISGTGDFTAECWIYPTTAPASYNIIACSDANTGLTMFGLNNNGTIFMGRSLVDVQATTSNSVNYNAWNYLAITRSSGTLRLFINGVQGFSGSITTSYNSGTVRFGTDGGGSSLPYTGYISNFRINPNSALYTSGFTPPTAPTTAISGTSLLLNYTNGAIYDNAMMNDLETVGNAQISTSVVKYGTGSLAFDGTGDWLVPRNLLPLGGGNFTVEMWLYPNATYSGAYAGILDSRTSGDGAGLVYFGYTGTANQIGWKDNTTNVVTGSVTLSTWNHVAVVRSSGTMTMYINGTSTSSSANSTNYTVALD